MATFSQYLNKSTRMPAFNGASIDSISNANAANTKQEAALSAYKQRLKEQENEKRKRFALSKYSGKNKLYDAREALVAMVNEPEKQQVPTDDVQHLISSLSVQRNIALNKVALEQARNKSLLILLEAEIEKNKKLSTQLEQLDKKQ